MPNQVQGHQLQGHMPQLPSQVTHHSVIQQNHFQQRQVSFYKQKIIENRLKMQFKGVV